ncbi:MAG: hypothetical protein HY231_15095 [Acidobacteria bacterium]|nr:hypothetical protein [Acidobacteriota bacterium]
MEFLFIRRLWHPAALVFGYPSPLLRRGERAFLARLGGLARTLLLLSASSGLAPSRQASPHQKPFFNPQQICNTTGFFILFHNASLVAFENPTGDGLQKTNPHCSRQGQRIIMERLFAEDFV